MYPGAEAGRLSHQAANGGSLDQAWSSGEPGTAAAPSLPPPLPPRPADNRLGLPYQGFSGISGYSNYVSPYGSTPGFGYGIPSYGYNSMYGGQQESQVSRIAEERTRNAFQPIENVVRTFSSLSFLLDSSFNAIFTSFRAVLSLADQFSQLKEIWKHKKLQEHFQHLLATLSLLRLARWLWIRLKILLGYAPPSSLDGLWQGNEAVPQLLLPESSGSAKDWSFLLLGSVAILGPWLIWKLTSRLVHNAKAEMLWATGKRPFYQAIALYDFRPANSSELAISAGTQIRIAPKELQPQVRGWLLASQCDDSEQCGLVPANYVKLIASQPGSPPRPPLDSAWSK